MNGYDLFRANPYNKYGDPAIRARIFLHDCHSGYYNFVSDVRVDMHCQSDFSMKTISSAKDYENQRNSANSYSAGVSADAGKFFVQLDLGYVNAEDRIICAIQVIV